MRKSKFPPELKVKIVEQVLDGELTQGKAAALCGVHKSAIQEWLHLYHTFGITGLVPPKACQVMTARRKKQAVEAYLQGNGSLADICHKYGIRTRSSLLGWVKAYNKHIEFQKPGIHGAHRSEVYMRNGKATTQKERIEMVSYCLDHGTDYAAVVEKYGVSYNQIYSWVKKFRENGVAGLEDRRGKKRIIPEMNELEQLRAENRMLKKQNQHLELENIVLKKLKEIEGRRS